MNKIHYSKVNNPEEWPEVKSITIRPRWLMTATLWVLKRLGFDVHDLRRK